MRGAAVLVMFAGCSFTHGSLSSDGSTTPPDEAGPGDTKMPDAPTPLVDEGLLVRYFIDEADSGQVPTQLVDSAPSPLPLDLHYTTVMNFVLQFSHYTLAMRTKMHYYFSKLEVFFI